MVEQPRTYLRPTAGPSAEMLNSTSGSETIVESSSAASATLRLRASPDQDSERHIQWADDVVDNEGMGKKSSKVCCIYHKPHEPGHSDTESSSSSSDSGSDSEQDLSKAQRARGKGRNRAGKDREHNHPSHASNSKSQGKRRKPSPNAYERQPNYKPKNDV